MDRRARQYDVADAIADEYLDMRDVGMPAHDVLVVCELARLLVLRMLAIDPAVALAARREAEAVLAMSSEWLVLN